MASDLDTLLDMGFDKARAELAVKKTGGREFGTPPHPALPQSAPG
jgi:hypothetical protein